MNKHQILLSGYISEKNWLEANIKQQERELQENREKLYYVKEKIERMRLQEVSTF